MRGGSKNDEGGKVQSDEGEKYKVMRGRKVENNKKICFIFSGSYLMLQL